MSFWRVPERRFLAGFFVKMRLPRSSNPKYICTCFSLPILACLFACASYLQYKSISLFMPTPLKPYKFGCRMRKPLSLSLGNLAIAHLLLKQAQGFCPSSFVREHLEYDSYILMSGLLRLKGGVGGTFMDLGYMRFVTPGVWQWTTPIIPIRLLLHCFPYHLPFGLNQAIELGNSQQCRF